ncbi:hypothetical protein RBB50_005339 [Rhinocladiella similis]
MLKEFDSLPADVTVEAEESDAIENDVDEAVEAEVVPVVGESVASSEFVPALAVAAAAAEAEAEELATAEADTAEAVDAKDFVATAESVAAASDIVEAETMDDAEESGVTEGPVVAESYVAARSEVVIDLVAAAESFVTTELEVAVAETLVVNIGSVVTGWSAVNGDSAVVEEYNGLDMLVATAVSVDAMNPDVTETAADIEESVKVGASVDVGDSVNSVVVETGDDGALDADPGLSEVRIEEDVNVVAPNCTSVELPDSDGDANMSDTGLLLGLVNASEAVVELSPEPDIVTLEAAEITSEETVVEVLSEVVLDDVT